MTYKLAFLESAKKEWDKLGSPIREQFKKKLKERLANPHHSKDKLKGISAYKIKLRASGYRLVYRTFDDRLVVQVVSVGKRDKSLVYEIAVQRLQK